ncbi:hypothetical protein ACISK3_06975 [Morganella morganii]|nr:hypothetical protein [Morganella morganii]
MVALILSSLLIIGDLHQTDTFVVMLPNIKSVGIENNLIPWCIFEHKNCLNQSSDHFYPI